MALKYISSASYYNGGTGSVDKGDAAKRNILEGRLDVTNESGLWIDWLEATGRFAPTSDEDFYSYTNDWLFSTLTVTGAGGSGAVTAGTTGTVTVTSATAAAKLKRGDIIHVPATGDSVMVASVAGAVITFAVASDGATVTIANDAVLTVPYNLIPEGSYAGDDPEVDMQRKTNRINIIESATSSTDLRAAAKYVIDLGNGERGVIYSDQHNLWLKHRGKEAFALLTGQYLTFDAADTGFSADVKSSRGLDSYIEDYGGNVTTATAADTAANGILSNANFDVADWADFSRKLDLSRAPGEGDLMAGGDIAVNFYDVMKDYLGSTGIDFAKLGSGSYAKNAVDFKIKSVDIFDRVYHIMKAPVMDHQYATATAGSIYRKSMYFIPAGKIKAGGKSVDRMRVRYLDMGGFADGRIHEKVLGGLAPGRPTERTNKAEWSYTSWIGLEVNGTQHFGKFIGV